MSIKPEKSEVWSFWEGRAELGLAAGTKDLIGKQLEMEAISRHAADGMVVLDAGCGNGITAISLAQRFDAEVIGFDYSDKMVEAAQKLAAETALKGRLSFEVNDVMNPSFSEPRFNLVYTERTLINLPDWESQRRAIENLAAVLVPGGCYVMCECSQDALDRINSMRTGLDLPVINPPWHNRYLRDEEIDRTSIRGLRLERIEDFSSTYYFLSRVVNAWLAAQKGEEPRYDAPVNTLALKLPPIGDFGQTRVWVWRKE